LGTLVAWQALPVVEGEIPVISTGCKLFALEVVIGFLVRRHHTGPGAGFDGHIAQRHTPFHGKVSHRLTGKLNDMSVATCCANFTYYRQRDVFCRAVFRQAAVYPHQHGPGFFLRQGLRGHHVFDFGSADAKGQCTEGTVGGGVAVAAYRHHARVNKSVLGYHDMNHTIVGAFHVVEV